jgi:hypothetical protein
MDDSSSSSGVVGMFVCGVICLVCVDVRGMLVCCV